MDVKTKICDKKEASLEGGSELANKKRLFVTKFVLFKI